MSDKQNLEHYKKLQEASINKDWKTLSKFIDDERDNLDFHLYQLCELSDCIMDALHSYHFIRATEQKDSDWMDEVMIPYATNQVDYFQNKIAKNKDAKKR